MPLKPHEKRAIERACDSTFNCRDDTPWTPWRIVKLAQLRARRTYSSNTIIDALNYAEKLMSCPFRP